MNLALHVLSHSYMVQTIYLDELGNIRDLPLITSLAVLPTVPLKKAPAEARDIIACAKASNMRRSLS